MSNPLLDKFYELYPEKKEEPKPKPEYVKLSEEQMDIVSKYLTTPDKYSTQSTITTTNLTSSGNGITAITAANHFPKLTSYDVDSGKDSFLQIAEKVKNGEAKVSSISVERDIMSGTSITFEVLVWDT